MADFLKGETQHYISPFTIAYSRGIINQIIHTLKRKIEEGTMFAAIAFIMLIMLFVGDSAFELKAILVVAFSSMGILEFINKYNIYKALKVDESVKYEGLVICVLMLILGIIILLA